METYNKQCPKCGKTLIYKTKSTLKQSMRSRGCYSCFRIGYKYTDVERAAHAHQWFAKGNTVSLGNKLSDSFKVFTSNRMKGNTIPLGLKRSEDTKQKMSIAQCNRKSSSFYKYKKYSLPSGKQVRFQGYENLTNDLLFSEGNVEGGIEFENTPIIKYEYDGKRQYIPDCFISSINTIIETKSVYTWKRNEHKNWNKILSAINSGYNLRLVIWNRKKQKIKDVTFKSTLTNDSIV